MRIAFITLGCKLNYAETSTYERGFTAAGLQTVPWSEGADVFLVNTCSVTQHSDYKCRNIISKCHRISPSAAIVVTGCYASLRRDEVSSLPGVRLVFSSDEKSRVVPKTLALLGLEGLDEAPPKPLSPAISSGGSADIIPAYSYGERTRSFLKVQDGCDNFCAYCTVPYARGRSRNLPICEIVRQAKEIASRGVKEIVLTGVNTGDFGRSTGESFLNLIQALNEVEGIERYRISSIEPNLLTEEIIAWIASGTKFLPHFHIPLQAGCDSILRSMGRRYDTALFESRIGLIRSGMETPGRAKVFFGIDVIAGLPGESEEKFEEGYRFLRDRIHPAYLHIFPYSPRPGTRAAAMGGQVQDRVKTGRVARLQELCDALHREFVETNRGLPERVLWEKAEKGGLMSGYTGNYIRIEAPYDPSKVGKIEDIVI